MKCLGDIELQEYEYTYLRRVLEAIRAKKSKIELELNDAYGSGYPLDYVVTISERFIPGN